MKRSILIIGVSLLLGGLLVAAPAMAQDHDQASETGEQARQTNMPQDTMEVVGPNERPEDVDRKLAVPETASEQGKKSSSHGMETANEAREKGMESGQDRAEEAHEMDHERAEEVRERARERAREAREHSSDEAMRERMRERMGEHDGARDSNH